MKSDRKLCGCVMPDNTPCPGPAVDFIEVKMGAETCKMWMCAFHYDGWMARNRCRVFEVKSDPEPGS